MKVLLLLGLFVLSGARWVSDYRPLQRISELEPMEEDSQTQEIDKIHHQFNLHGYDGDGAFNANSNMADSLEDQVKALPSRDATSRTQKDLGGAGVERQELVAGGRIISSQSDDREDSRFMDVPADTQIVDDREDSRFMDFPTDIQNGDDREDSRFMDFPADIQIVDDRKDSRFRDFPADIQNGDDREDSRFMDVPADIQIMDDRKGSRFRDFPSDIQTADEIDDSRFMDVQADAESVDVHRY